MNIILMIPEAGIALMCVRVCVCVCVCASGAQRRCCGRSSHRNAVTTGSVVLWSSVVVGFVAVR